MTLKNLMTVAAVAALTASSALAQPSVSLDLVRDGSGIAQLSADGNWQFVITVTQDTIVDIDGGGDGDSLSLQGGLTLTDSPLVTGSVITSFEAAGGMNGGFTNSDLFDTLIPAEIVFGFADPLTNPGVTGSGVGGAFPLGIVEGVEAPALSNVNFGIGSDEVGGGTGTAGLAVEALFFDVEGPSTATAGSLTTTVDLVSVLVSQATPDGSSALTSLADINFTATAIPGDADLDGDVDIDDLAVFGGGAFDGSTGAGFSAGDFDRDGDIDIDDLAQFGGGAFDSVGVAPVVAAGIPEPSSAILLIAASALACGRSRRS